MDQGVLVKNFSLVVLQDLTKKLLNENLRYFKDLPMNSAIWSYDNDYIIGNA